MKLLIDFIKGSLIALVGSVFLGVALILLFIVLGIISDMLVSSVGIIGGPANMTLFSLCTSMAAGAVYSIQKHRERKGSK